MGSLEEAIFQLVQEHDVNLVTGLRKACKVHLLQKFKEVDPLSKSQSIKLLHRVLFPEDFENERVSSENDPDTERDGYYNPRASYQFESGV